MTTLYPRKPIDTTLLRRIVGIVSVRRSVVIRTTERQLYRLYVYDLCEKRIIIHYIIDKSLTDSNEKNPHQFTRF